MAGPKESAHAFMPSSNDSLFAPVNGGYFHRNISNSSSRSPPLNSGDEIAVTNGLPNETAVLSPLSLINRSDDSISPTDMSTTLPIRRFVASASSLPAAETRPATDQTFWHDHYRQAMELHSQERMLWEEEKGFLEREIVKLKQELRGKRSDSVTSSLSNKENDKVYPNADVIRQAQEKLRGLSNASTNIPSTDQYSSITTSVRKTSRDMSPGHQELAVRSSLTFPPTTSSGQQLTSISEDETPAEPGRRVSINDISTTIENPSPDNFLLEEQPASPPTSAWIPTPPNARVHAGRTPPIPISMNDGALDLSSSIANTYHNAVIEDDPELSSPKQLPSSPQNGQTEELSDLNKKLEQVASDPEANLPEVVRSTEATPSASTSPSTVPKQHPDGGEVKLRTKRSLNFGVPLGAPIRDPRKM